MSSSSSRKTTAILVAVLVTVSIVAGGLAVTAQEAGGNDSTVETDDPQQTSYLRVMHASPGAPDVNVTLTEMDGESNVTDTETMVGDTETMDAEAGTVLANVSFGDTSDYQKLSAGEYTVTVTEAGGNGSTIYEDNVTLEPRTANTVAISGQLIEEDTLDDETEEDTIDDETEEDTIDDETEEDTLDDETEEDTIDDETEEDTIDDETEGASGLQAVHYVDNALEPDGDNATLRVHHLSPDAPAVDVVTEDGTVLAANVSFQNSSDYVTVPSGDYTVEIRAAGQAEDDNLTETETDDNLTETETATAEDEQADNETEVGTGEVVATVDVTLENGTAYSAVAVGLAGDATETDDGEETADGGADTALDVRLLEDATITLSPMSDDEMTDEETTVSVGNETDTNGTETDAAT